MFGKKTIHDYDVYGKKVLLRADYNVPLNTDGSIASDYRITESIPTIRALQEKGCRIVIIAHLGRPKGKRDKKLSLKVVAKELSGLLNSEVTFVPDCVGEKVATATQEMESGEVVLLENLRYHPEEKANDEEFAKKLLADTGAEVFVQDGFGIVHRAHTSTDAITRFIPSVSGLLLEKEVGTISAALHQPNRPLMAIIGGAKIADKIDIINRFLDIADIVVIGGAMSNTFMAAQGIEVGESLVAEEEIDTAHEIIERVRQVCAQRQFIFYLPQDGVVARKVDKGARTRVVDWDGHVFASVEHYPKKPEPRDSKVRKDEMILDIGPFSAAFISGAMQMCKTVVWNGTMGVSEVESVYDSVGPFAHGTESIIESMVGKYGNKPYTLVGGGDTTSYLDQRGLQDMFNHVSTGGGASLELMAGKELPGVTVLWGKE